jgi:hypothetical protein
VKVVLLVCLLGILLAGCSHNETSGSVSPNELAKHQKLKEEKG